MTHGTALTPSAPRGQRRASITSWLGSSHLSSARTARELYAKLGAHPVETRRALRGLGTERALRRA